MAIRLKCAHCGRAIAVTRRAAGTQVPCPVCRQTLDIPALTTAICTRERTLAPAAAVEPVVVEPPMKSEKPRWTAGVNYRLVGTAAAASVGVLTVVALVVAAAGRRPAYRQWASTEATGRVSPAMKLAYLGRPLHEAPDADDVPAVPFESQTVAAPHVDEMQYQPPAPLVVNRRDQLDDEALRKQLLKVPELGLYKGKRFAIVNSQLRTGPLHDVIDTVALRRDLTGLRMIPAPDCQLGKEPAERLQAVSTELRTKMFAAVSGRGAAALTADPTGAVNGVLSDQLRRYKAGFSETTIPAAMQMLCVENRTVRQAMIDHLAQINHKTSSRALAKMAVFDLSAQVRANALQILAERPRGEYRQVLLDGLRYPWAPAADHAAEALVVLEDTDALPSLKDLAKLPNPSAPLRDADSGHHYVREVVRVNHLGNCMLCHAPSKSTTDLVRGRIATPGEALPPPVQYYGGQDGIFVRADITYLRQDFSVIQPVDDHGAWPSQQRFDYLVRNRPISKEEAQELARVAPTVYPQREAVEHAIQQLTSLPAKPRPNDELTLGAIRR